MSTVADPHATDVDLRDLDLMDSRVHRGGFPHAIFNRLRQEAPVWWQPVDDGPRCADPGFWVVSKCTSSKCFGLDRAFSKRQFSF